MIKIIAIPVLLLFTLVGVQGRQPFEVRNDTLYVYDGISTQVFLWKEGKLSLVQSASKKTTQIYSSYKNDIGVLKEKPETVSYNIVRLPATLRSAASTRIDLTAKYKAFETRRSLIIYDNSPGVEWRLAVKGKHPFKYKTNYSATGLIENPELLSDNQPHYFSLPAAGSFWTTKTILFKEATDHHTNLLQKKQEFPYKKSQYYNGSVLQMQYPGFEHLIVKLSPLQNAQAVYAGFDFSTDLDGVKVHSPGLTADSSNLTEWQEAYPLFVVMYAENEDVALGYYKNFELNVNKYIPALDNTFTMNTWGDRNQDSRINEKFILNELDAAARLGITHFQIDDGWQQGLSLNSASKHKLLWDDWGDNDWQINKTRFPNGFEAVLKKSASLNMHIGLWFNPSKQHNHLKWERDKNILVNLYQQYGISWIKIDGLQLANKQAEQRVTTMLDQARKETAGKLSFNMDVTAGLRGGYFFLNRTGNIFLENRYTDWGNYYPHLTLRNAWMLSKYIPLQRLQIEFLNKWRNTKMYKHNDPLSPVNIPFDYMFATTMMAQPLAWMEATGLPREAFAVNDLVQVWKKHRSDMQSGIIYPIGDMPNGRNFTGFASYTRDKVYVLLFREYTTGNTGHFKLPDTKEHMRLRTFIPLAGNGKVSNVKQDSFSVNMPQQFQFLFGYFVR